MDYTLNQLHTDAHDVATVLGEYNYQYGCWIYKDDRLLVEYERSHVKIYVRFPRRFGRKRDVQVFRGTRDMEPWLWRSGLWKRYLRQLAPLARAESERRVVAARKRRVEPIDDSEVFTEYKAAQKES